jgi:hypothetical protein
MFLCFFCCFSSCTPHASTRMNHTQQQHHLFFVLCFYTLCAPSASFMRNTSACSSLRHCSSLQVVHCSSSSLLHSSTTESLHFSVLHAFLMSSHLLIIMETLHLLWWFHVACEFIISAVMLRFLSFSGSRDSSSSLSVTTSQLWLLWLLSPFLRVTTGGDQALIQKVLPDFLSSERWLHFMI